VSRHDGEIPNVHDQAAAQRSDDSLAGETTQRSKSLQTAGRARIRELEDALASLDEPLVWIAENYPAVMREMPTDYWRAIKYAGKVLTRGS
jgi:hypothetical protein